MKIEYEKIYPFWTEINDKQKNYIIKSMQCFHFGTGDNVKLKDATKKNGLLVVVSGFLRLYLSDNGREITVSEVRQGEAFCILTIDDASENDAMPNLQAREDTTIAYLNVSALEVLASESSEVSKFLLKTVISSSQNILNNVSHHFFNNIRSRLAKFIVDNTECENDNSCIIGITHEQLANNLGTSRVVVSRELEYFNELGLIKTGRCKIYVYNVDELKRMAGY